MQVPAVSGQTIETDLDIFEIVGVLEGTAVVDRFDKGRVTFRLGVVKAALPLDSAVGGWMGTAAPPIQRQIHTEVHQVLLFWEGRGRRLSGLPLSEGFGHGQEHVGVVGQGCWGAAEAETEYIAHKFAFLPFLNFTMRGKIFHLSIYKVSKLVEPFVRSCKL